MSMSTLAKGMQHSNSSRGLQVCLLLLLVAAAIGYAPYSAAGTKHAAKHVDRVWQPAFSAETNVINHYRLAHADNQISMREAIAKAKRRFPGKVLAAKRTINRQGKVIYRIKIISNTSEIRTISIKADR